MISQKPSLFPVVRLLSGARQAMALLASRLPPPLRQRASSALNSLAARWPRLASLLGMQSVTAGAPAARPVIESTDDADGSLESTQTRATALADLRSGGDLLDRVRAARALASIVDDEATAALATALRDASTEVAVEAAEALGSHRADRAIAALRTALDNGDGYYSPMTRAASVRSLGGLLPIDQWRTIATAVTDVDSTVSLAAIGALAERHEAAATGVLKAVLEDRAGFYLPATRQAAARALLRLRGLDDDTCRGLLENEADATVREVLVALQAAAPN